MSQEELSQEGKELLERYLSDVAWLRCHLATDDVYDFAYQSVMIAQYFMGCLIDKTDFIIDIKEDPLLMSYARNMVGLSRMMEEKSDAMIQVDINIVPK